MKVQRFLINKILLYHLCQELKKQFAEINAQKEEGGGAVLVPLRVFSLERSRREPPRDLLSVYGVKEIQATPTKKDLGTS